MDDVKILMLKSGLHVITKLSQVKYEGKEEPVCFMFTAPLVITYDTPTEETNINLKFTLWSPFSKSVEFRVPFDHVISMGEPKDDIYSKYMEIASPLFELLENNNTEQTEEETE